MSLSHRAVRAFAAACSLAPVLIPLMTATAAPTTSGEHRVAAQPTTITTTVTDGDDTHGRLDISKVTHRISYINPRGRVQITYRVKTFHPYHVGLLNPRQRRFVIELDTDGSPGAERNVRVSARNGHLTGDVISNATRKIIATVAVARPAADTLRVAGPRRLIGAHRYFLYSDFHAEHSRHCGRYQGYPITCQDDVPGAGGIRLDRPAWPHERAELARQVGAWRHARTTSGRGGAGELDKSLHAVAMRPVRL
jgi:hypothetical protein